MLRAIEFMLVLRGDGSGVLYSFTCCSGDTRRVEGLRDCTKQCQVCVKNVSGEKSKCRLSFTPKW